MLTGGNKRLTRRFGIGEWYGQSFVDLPEEKRVELARHQIDSTQKGIPCPPQSRPGIDVECNKPGGVCSLRLYERETQSKGGKPVGGEDGRLRTTCPLRFEEKGLIYRWVGETLLEDPFPIVLNEIGFLERLPEHRLKERAGRSEDVGRIDNVLVSKQKNGQLVWCALEKQAVYFQGSAMGKEWRGILEHQGEGLPFPMGRRVPDYRSSGPKRLMPQLQIKVPTLRRWGKRMAVIVDEVFFDSLGRMEASTEISNCDIVWFIVGFEERNGAFEMVPRRHHLTTLEGAVIGLTAGNPVSLETFEQRIRDRIS